MNQGESHQRNVVTPGPSRRTVDDMRICPGPCDGPVARAPAMSSRPGPRDASRKQVVTSWQMDRDIASDNKNRSWVARTEEGEHRAHLPKEGRLPLGSLANIKADLDRSLGRRSVSSRCPSGRSVARGGGKGKGLLDMHDPAKASQAVLAVRRGVEPVQVMHPDDLDGRRYILGSSIIDVCSWQPPLVNFHGSLQIIPCAVEIKAASVHLAQHL
jgi:hypothetical protein